MKTYLAIIISLFSLACAYGEPTYYAVFSGKNDENKVWHMAPNDAAFKTAVEANEIFDSYTLKSEKGHITKALRSVATPSGDWAFRFVYYYNNKGTLTKIIADFWTFTGYDAETDDFSPTRSVSVFEKNKKNDLVKVSEKITDPKTGNIVKRNFYMPEVAHWLTVKGIPKPEKPTRLKK